MPSRFLTALKSVIRASAPSEQFTLAERPTTIDRLGFERLVTAVADRIATANKSETPFTIGIYGKWGAGKTSFMMMVDKQSYLASTMAQDSDFCRWCGVPQREYRSFNFIPHSFTPCFTRGRGGIACPWVATGEFKTIHYVV